MLIQSILNGKTNAQILISNIWHQSENYWDNLYRNTAYWKMIIWIALLVFEKKIKKLWSKILKWEVSGRLGDG